MHEIERKFLVTKPLLDIVGKTPGKQVEQCYLGNTGDWTVRVRRVTNSAAGYVSCTKTMKRKLTDRKCIELETTVSEDYFNKVAKLSGSMLEKRRYGVLVGNHVWDVDYFPQFDGLIVAEVELDDEDATFVRPDWLGEEVTHKKQYKNARMARKL